MTVRYKNAGFNLTTTGTTSVLTAPTTGRCLIKQIQAHNGSSGAEGDILKLTAGTANEIQGIVSYALIDRSQENG